MPKGIYKRSEETKRKMSKLHKGKTTWKIHPRGMLGKIPWNKDNLLVEKLICEKCKLEFIAKPCAKRKFCSRKCAIKIRETENGTNWKGDAVGYGGLHARVKRALGRSNKCEHCKTTTAKKFEWANKSHRYLTDLSDWIRLCTKCHIAYDKKPKLQKELKDMSVMNVR